VTTGFHIWTSGIQDNKKSVSWCTKKGPAENFPMNWATDQMMNGGCISLILSNTSFAESTFTPRDCATVQNFVCEVRRFVDRLFESALTHPFINRKLRSYLKLISRKKSAKTSTMSLWVCIQ
jgi:hypothetical protein